MRKALLLLLVSLFALSAWAQVQVSRAYLGTDGEVLVETVQTNESLPTIMQGSKYSQLPGWPKKVASHPNFKNFRGVTLADLDGDGADEILVAAYNSLKVYKGNGTLLWSKTLTGTAIYPPSVAVMDGLGTLGIVQVTGGIPNNGRIYYMDVNGNDHPGWPVNFSSHWILCAPVIADITGNGIKEIIVQTRTSNNLHVLNTAGQVVWTVSLEGTPAFTPSVADIDNDGNPEIIACNSAGVLFAFDKNGQHKPGFPVPSDSYSFSYQSPLLVDLDGNSQLSIIGATHGDAPKFYVRNSNGTYRDGWPVPVQDNSWTYCPPTAVDLQANGDYSIFMSRPVSDVPAPMLWGFHENGSVMDGFPIVKAGGLESFMSIADISGDGNHDIIFGSNMMVDGKGFIHAYPIGGSTELEGFPLRPFGFTYMNGPNLGDVNGDGMLNLVALSYEQTFSVTDSAFINVYDLQIPVAQADVLFGTYKGSNDRTGYVRARQAAISVDPTEFEEFALLGEIFTRDLTIINSGNAPLNYILDIEFIGNDWEWLSSSSYEGTIISNSQTTIELTFNFDDWMQQTGDYYANIHIASNDPMNPIVTVPVVVSIYINSINQPETGKLLIYPNPASRYLNIVADFVESVLTIQGVDGSLKMSRVIPSGKTMVDLDQLEPGVYIINLTAQDGTKARSKLVKTK